MLSEAKHLVPQLVQRDSSLAPLAQNDKFTLVGLRRSFASVYGQSSEPVYGSIIGGWNGAQGQADQHW